MQRCDPWRIKFATGRTAPYSLLPTPYSLLPTPFAISISCGG
ncbi:MULTISPECIES: hypothetical protein [Moorena]|uniref:Uncharacterized protein n=1 Tax=Moorena producens (strain JHB) TaxID=1454205 RepID=A0A9Q9SU02_MOOP1|nr:MULTISPECIES: hypothetical protein [Moorena]WAN69637.1 hypothetical protein BJP36_36705 [Moorena producens JHB]